MEQHPIELLIEKADTTINQEDFDTLIDIYTDDAVLVIQPGMNAVGKEQIRKAFESIAAHFEHTLNAKQSGIEILEAGDTALVLAKTLVSAKGQSRCGAQSDLCFQKRCKQCLGLCS